MTQDNPTTVNVDNESNTKKDQPQETTTTKGIAHPISTSILNADKDIIKAYQHSKRVGNYLLGKTLGEGSFAKVKEALHALTTTKVAVKVIDKKKATRDNYVRKNLRREGRILQTVRHANIAHLYEIMETDNYYYLVMELCEGGDLMDRIYKQKRLEEVEVRKYMRQIISAVDYLHRAGIIHRDLKIENLLLNEKQDVKIIDFGLSNTVKLCPPSESLENRPKECLCGTQCGSPAYAAPELLANKKYGPEVDVWSIGVNMYAMLTGTLPFTVQPFNIQHLQNKMLKGEMNPLPAHLSINCKDLILKLLTPNPIKRITLQQAMVHHWIREGKNGGYLIPSKFPNKLKSADLDTTVLSHIADKLKFRSAEVSQLVIANTPHPYTATYMLLKRKIDRWRQKSYKDGTDKMVDLARDKARSKIQPFKRRQAEHITDLPKDDNNASETPQSDAKVKSEAVKRENTTVTAVTAPAPEPATPNPEQKSSNTDSKSSEREEAPTSAPKPEPKEHPRPQPLQRKNTEIRTNKPIQVVLPARRCNSVLDLPLNNTKINGININNNNINRERDMVTDVMSPRAADGMHPAPTAPPSVGVTNLNLSSALAYDLTEPDKFRGGIPKHLDTREPTNLSLSQRESDDPALQQRNRIAPIRLLGKGPYVIKTHPKLDGVGNPSIDPKSVDYEDWRQSVMRRNVVDNSKYDSFASTRNAKQSYNTITAEPFDLNKFVATRPRPPLLKPSSKIATGFENNQMMRMLHKRSTQPNSLLYESKEENREFSRSNSIGTGKPCSTTNDSMKTVIQALDGGNTDTLNGNLALPSIDAKHKKPS